MHTGLRFMVSSGLGLSFVHEIMWWSERDIFFQKCAKTFVHNLEIFSGEMLSKSDEYFPSRISQKVYVLQNSRMVVKFACMQIKLKLGFRRFLCMIVIVLI